MCAGSDDIGPQSRGQERAAAVRHDMGLYQGREVYMQGVAELYGEVAQDKPFCGCKDPQ